MVSKVIKYLMTYVVWIANMGLALWFAYLCKTTLVGIFAFFYTGNVAYANAVNFIDKAFTIALGLGWLAFMIIVEAYFRTGTTTGDLPRRFANVTGPLLLGIFCVDLILFWLQGAGVSWLRWLILATELGGGIAMIVSVRSQSKPKSN